MAVLDAELLPHFWGNSLILLTKTSLIFAARQVFANYKFFLLLWLTNVVFAAAITLPISNLFMKDLLHSYINSHFSGEFDFYWYLQFRAENRPVLEQLPLLLISLTVIYNFIQLFYSAGLISVLGNPKKNHISDFFYGGVQYFFRFVLIFLASVTVHFVLISVYTLLKESAEIVLGGVNNQGLIVYANIVIFTFFLFMISLLNLLGDYTKILVVLHDSRSILLSVKKSVLFIYKNFPIVFFLFIVTSSFVAAAAVVYNVLDSFIPKGSLVLIALTFFIQQLLIIFRILIKMMFFSSEIFLYRELDAQVIITSAEEIKSGV